MYGYVITEYNKVKDSFPEFKTIMETLRTTLVTKCQSDWSPKTFGGMYPRAGQFGESPIMPELFDGLATAYQPLVTWNQWFSGTGNQTIMTGAATGNTIYEDYQIGLAGLVFLDKAIRVAEIRMQIADRKIPRINIEECMAYEQPAIVFEQPFILDEESGFDLYAYVTTLGPQRIKLLGIQMNRVPNKLQVSNTGAALM